MNSAVSSIFLCFVALVGQISALDQCPTVPTVDNFDFDKIGGNWYSIEESSPPRLPCLHYNLSHDGQVMTTQFLPYGIILKAKPKDPKDTTKGFDMISNFNLLDKANWAIFDTDYSKCLKSCSERIKFIFISQLATAPSSLAKSRKRKSSNPSLCGREKEL